MAISCSLNRRRNALPVAVLGSWSRNSNSLGCHILLAEYSQFFLSHFGSLDQLVMKILEIGDGVLLLTLGSWWIIWEYCSPSGNHLRLNYCHREPGVTWKQGLEQVGLKDVETFASCLSTWTGNSTHLPFPCHLIRVQVTIRSSQVLRSIGFSLIKTLAAIVKMWKIDWVACHRATIESSILGKSEYIFYYSTRYVIRKE